MHLSADVMQSNWARSGFALQDTLLQVANCNLALRACAAARADPKDQCMAERAYILM